MAVVVVASAGSVGDGDRHLYVAVVLVVKLYPVRTRYQLKRICVTRIA